MKEWKNEKIKIIATEGEITDEIIEEFKKQTIYWSDSLNQHYFFMFKVNEFWVENISINNELTIFKIAITKF
jgi:hypothetical protein